MSKSLTSLTLALALTFAASAYADSANAEGDVYEESIWDIHASADPDTGKSGKTAAGETAAGDVYEEALWGVEQGVPRPAVSQPAMNNMPIVHGERWAIFVRNPLRSDRDQTNSNFE